MIERGLARLGYTGDGEVAADLALSVGLDDEGLLRFQEPEDELFQGFRVYLVASVCADVGFLGAVIILQTHFTTVRERDHDLFLMPDHLHDLHGIFLVDGWRFPLIIIR